MAVILWAFRHSPASRSIKQCKDMKKMRNNTNLYWDAGIPGAPRCSNQIPFSHSCGNCPGNHKSLLDITTECFSELAVLLRLNNLLCSSPCYLLMWHLGMILPYFGCHVLALCVEELFEVAIFLDVWHGSQWMERYEDSADKKWIYLLHDAIF